MKFCFKIRQLKELASHDSSNGSN